MSTESPHNQREVAALVRSAGHSIITESFLDSIAWHESRNRDNVRGSAGERGRFQIRAVAVREVNRKFGWRVQHMDVVDPVIGQAVARAYCTILEDGLRRHLHRQPTQSEIYAMASVADKTRADPSCEVREACGESDANKKPAIAGTESGGRKSESSAKIARPTHMVSDTWESGATAGETAMSYEHQKTSNSRTHIQSWTSC